MGLDLGVRYGTNVVRPAALWRRGDEFLASGCGPPNRVTPWPRLSGLPLAILRHGSPYRFGVRRPGWLFSAASNNLRVFRIYFLAADPSGSGGSFRNRQLLGASPGAQFCSVGMMPPLRGLLLHCGAMWVRQPSRCGLGTPAGWLTRPPLQRRPNDTASSMHYNEAQWCAYRKRIGAPRRRGCGRWVFWPARCTVRMRADSFRTARRLGMSPAVMVGLPFCCRHT